MKMFLKSNKDRNKKIFKEEVLSYSIIVLSMTMLYSHTYTALRIFDKTAKV